MTARYERLSLRTCSVLPCGTGAWRTSTRNNETQVTAATMTHKLSFSSVPGVWGILPGSMKQWLSSLLACRQGKISDPSWFLTHLSWRRFLGKHTARTFSFLLSVTWEGAQGKFVTLSAPSQVPALPGDATPSSLFYHK